MTSELLSMNKSAIALAADSAVTINGKKVRNGVEKLFKLSNDPPMGMMIFGNANFDNIPMETLIKQYSKNADFKSLENIENIQEDFLKYLGRVTPPFDFKKAIDDNIGEYADELKGKFINISEEEFDKFMDEIEIDDSLDFAKSLPEFCLIDSLIEDILPDFVLDSEKDDLIIILKMNFFMKILSSSTGVVIAGFNEEDLFPSFVSFDLIVNCGGNIKCKLLESEFNYSLGYIMPFAQRDVIDTFLTGSSVLSKEVLSFYLLTFLDKYIDLIIENISSNEKFDEKSIFEFKNELKKIKSLNGETIDNFMYFFEKWEGIVMRPILSSISTMPKMELVEMASSLINVTSLRRKIDSDIESVGGDIALAVITKNEGFMWINRINPPDYILNPHILNSS